MKPLLILIAALLFLATQAPVHAQSPKPTPSLGMNIASITDWATELPFVDAFKSSRVWCSQKQGAAWGAGPRLDLDENGWVKSLPEGVWAESPMFSFAEPGHYPAGDYILLYQGKGKLQFAHTSAAKIIDDKPGRMVVRVDPTKGGLFLKLSDIDPTDYPRNIHFIMPGFEDTYQKEPWHPAFLKRLQGFSCIRFMECTYINLASPKSWPQRASLADETYTRKGIPLELCIDLCNRLQSDPWFCIPHEADDDYVRQFALLVKEKLSPGRKFYIEYSNETWNSIFPQNAYAAKQGQKLGFAEKPWEAAWRYTAYRSKQIFDICEKAMGTREKMVRVLATQAANPYVSQQVLGFQDAYKSADALGIAPYITLMPNPKSAPAFIEMGVEGILDKVEKEYLPAAITDIQKQKAIAEKYNLKLVCYEAGQHLVGIAGAESNQDLTRLFAQANRSPRMGAVYTRYYQAWVDSGGDMMAVFNSVTASSKYGSWGLLEYADQDPFKTPKMAATLAFARKLGQKVLSPAP